MSHRTPLLNSFLFARQLDDKFEDYYDAMRSPALVPVGIAIAICIVCAFAGGQQPHLYFQEWQPATVYNFLQLMLCGIVAAAILCTKWAKTTKVNLAIVFWSIATAGCFFLAADELFQFHESSGPIASFIKNSVGQSQSKYAIIAGHQTISFGNFVQLGYVIIAGAIAFYFRREVFSSAGASWMFAIGAAFLIGSEVLDFGMIHGHHVIFDPDGTQSDGIFKMLEESFKLAGFAMVLGALMETLMSLRQIHSVEKMLSELNKSELPVKALVHQ